MANAANAAVGAMKEHIIALQHELAEKEMLLSLSREIASVRDRKEVLDRLHPRLKELFGTDNIFICLVNDRDKTLNPFLRTADECRINNEAFRLFMTGPIPYDRFIEAVLSDGQPVVLDVAEVAGWPRVPPYCQTLIAAGIAQGLSARLHDAGENIGVLTFWSPLARSFTAHYVQLAQRIADQLSATVANILAHQKIASQLDEIRIYKEQLEEEKQYLQQEASSGFTYNDIIGNSPPMQRLFQELTQVASTDSTVLLAGETGTGKELVARAIHNASPRREKLMVKVNCAALPPQLIESELFGHEKGSFTGALDRRIGKFELANNGTLFLDEIGEIPLDLQTKLLRAIQEREIERIGGRDTIRINVRIIAATNRNLEGEVAEGRFRPDLFYRLHVFPITIPPLRERSEDIPLLVNHFINKFRKNTAKTVSNISARAMKDLLTYSWPGNVRELEHLIERSVLTTKGNTIKEVHLGRTSRTKFLPSSEERLKTFEENERDHIVRVLIKCGGKVYGPGGAAEILQLRVSTLNSKIKKLGIEKKKRFFHSGMEQ